MTQVKWLNCFGHTIDEGQVKLEDLHLVIDNLPKEIPANGITEVAVGISYLSERGQIIYYWVKK